MTVAEKKVKELASKLADQIEAAEKSGMAMDMILHGVKCYLSGIEDGISLSEEMREPDYSVQAPVGGERPLVGDGPHETISGGPKTTIGTVDPKITAHIDIDERDLPWNIRPGADL
jgi:hypothetical protein